MLRARHVAPGRDGSGDHRHESREVTRPEETGARARVMWTSGSFLTMARCCPITHRDLPSPGLPDTNRP